MLRGSSPQYRQTTQAALQASMEKLRKFPKSSERISERQFYAFTVFQIDPVKRLLLREGEPVPVTSKDFDILLELVEHRGEVLTKEELLQSVWPDAVVEEGNLSRHISTLRKVLGEAPEEHEYIVTVPGRGYRFVAGVKEVSGEASNGAGQASSRTGSIEGDAGSHSSSGARAPLSAVPTILTEAAKPASKGKTWGVRLGWVWEVAGTLAAVIVIVLASSGAWFKRSKPILTRTDYVLITDFTNSTRDAVFDDTIKQAVSVELAQSPFLNIVSDAKLHATLKLMAKPPDAKLTPDVAREFCQRSGCKMYIVGSIANLGNQFVIGLSAVDSRTGDTLVQLQVTADKKENVLKAIDQAAAEIREKLGESHSSLQEFDRPLEEATTSSLEALKSFSLGNKARDRSGDAATIPFYQRAIELDPNFALAYDALGISYSNLDEPGLASANIGKAYELRSRVSEREKFQIAANYSQMVTGDLEKANEISVLWGQTFPLDVYPHNLLGINHEFLGQYEKAVQEMSQAIVLNPDGVVLRSDLMEDYIGLNRLDEAKETYRTALELKLDHAYLHADRYGIAFLESDRPEMDRQVAWAAGRPGVQDLFFTLESDTSAWSGNLRQAREFSQRAVEFALHNNQKETAALWRVHAALREAEFGNFELSRRQTALAFVEPATRDVQILAALALARAGNSNRAQRMGDDLARHFPSNTVINGYWLPSIRAAIEINHGRPERAIDVLQTAVPYELGYPNPEVGVARFLYPAFLRGQAYLSMRRGSEAAVEFQKFFDHRSMVENCPLSALARLGMARAYAQEGDAAKARVAYNNFFEMWKNADSEISILNQAKAEYARLQ